jgi:hypothetical protein
MLRLFRLSTECDNLSPLVPFRIIRTHIHIRRPLMPEPDEIRRCPHVQSSRSWGVLMDRRRCSLSHGHEPAGAHGHALEDYPVAEYDAELTRLLDQVDRADVRGDYGRVVRIEGPDAVMLDAHDREILLDALAGGHPQSGDPLVEWSSWRLPVAMADGSYVWVRSMRVTDAGHRFVADFRSAGPR